MRDILKIQLEAVPGRAHGTLMRNVKPGDAFACVAEQLSTLSRFHSVTMSLGKTPLDDSHSTGLKIFDEQAARSSRITVGNVYSNVQFSSHIEAHNTTKNGSFDVPPGAMAKYGINSMLKAAEQLGLARSQIQQLNHAFLSLPPDQRAWAYLFFHKSRESEKSIINHGFLLVDADNDDLLANFNFGQSPLSSRVMEVAKEVVTHHLQDAQVLLRAERKAVTFIDPQLASYLANQGHRLNVEPESEDSLDEVMGETHRP